MEARLQKAIGVLDDVIFRLKLERFEGEAPVKMVAEKLSTHPKQVLRGAVGIVGGLSILLFLIFAQNLIFTALSVIYPAYATARTLQNADNFSRNGRLWLSYWTFYGLLAALNLVFGFVLHRIPFFNFIQCVFTVWLYHSTTKGAEFLNNSYLQPVLSKYAKAIEKRVSETADALSQATKQE